MSASKVGKEVSTVKKARLISLLITASLVAVLVAKVVVLCHGGGMSDGGY